MNHDPLEAFQEFEWTGKHEPTIYFSVPAPSWTDHAYRILAWTLEASAWSLIAGLIGITIAHW